MKRRLFLATSMAGAVGLMVPTAYMQSRKAPNFSFVDVAGKQHSLASLKGKVILVDQWATWCGPCKKEIPAFAELQKKHTDKVVILGISYDDDQSTLDNFLRKDQMGQKINYPIVFGSNLKQQPFGHPEALPTLFIIDKKGTIRKEHVGYMPADELNALVDKLLAEH